MQPNNVGTTDVTKLQSDLTHNLHCANSNEQSKRTPFPNLRAQQSKFGKHSQTDRYIQMTNKTMLNISAFNVPS